MTITAQWEIVLGNTYAYTVLLAFGLFYFGFGVIITPLFGVAEAYGGTDSPEYNNAVGFFVLSEYQTTHMFSCLRCAPANCDSSVGYLQVRRQNFSPFQHLVILCMPTLTLEL